MAKVLNNQWYPHLKIFQNVNIPLINSSYNIQRMDLPIHKMKLWKRDTEEPSKIREWTKKKKSVLFNKQVFSLFFLQIVEFVQARLIKWSVHFGFPHTNKFKRCRTSIGTDTCMLLTLFFCEYEYKMVIYFIKSFIFILAHFFLNK